jgi:2-haloacid dehalogenase
VRSLLQRAGLLSHFSALLSTDQVGKMKPHPEVYEMARREAKGETWMVAAHAWDIQGAIHAGFRTVFVSGLEKGYLDVYPKPDVTVAELGDVRTALAAAGALR